MNILYINHYAGAPKYGMEYRSFYMAKEWIKLNHKVTILAASFSHLRSYQPILSNNKQYEVIEGINYVWYKTPAYYSNGLGRLKNIISFLFKVWVDKRKIIKDFEPDVVIASSTYPMDIWIAESIAKKLNAKLIFEVHDLWPLSPIEIGGMSPYHPFVLWCKWAEKYAYKKSNIVISMLPNVHGYMKEQGLNLKKLHIIPNGIYEDDWNDCHIVPLANLDLFNFLRNEKLKEKIIVGYAGSHGQPNALEFLLDAAKKIDNDSLIFVLVGDGLEKNRLLSKKKLEEIKNVFFFDPVSKKEIPSLLKEFDIAYIGSQDIPLYRFGISPNKLMDYMMAGKPIICAIKAGNDPVADCQCGITVSSGNHAEIANAISVLTKLSPQERYEMGKKGQEYVLREHSYSVLADKFLKVLENE